DMFLDLFGGRADPIWLLNRLRSSATTDAAEPGVGVPPQLVLHGEDDNIVPVESSMAYARVAREFWGPDTVDLVIRPGDHGFDAELSKDTQWLREKLEKISLYWTR
ncbi:hypothetical protein HK405_007164, partial [Cladochytrium tenue]